MKIDIWWAAVVISLGKIQLDQNVFKNSAEQSNKAKMNMFLKM